MTKQNYTATYWPMAAKPKTYSLLRCLDGALDFFEARHIPFWSSAGSGDRLKDTSYRGPTRNLASSQVSCVNFLLPLATVPGAPLAFVQLFDPEVLAIEPIIDATGLATPVELEWVGWREPLEGGRKTRGALQTSLDALIVGRTNKSARAYLIEWKYCEEYLRPENKGQGSKGVTRTARYRHLYEAPTSSFNGRIPFEGLLYEPFYQMMRMILLGDRMLAEGVTETLAVDDFRVVVVCPTANRDFRQVVPATPVGRQLPPTTTVTDAMRGSLKNPRRLQLVAQDELVAALRRGPLRKELKPWLDYHAVRYRW
jgi:hypothetical protein